MTDVLVAEPAAPSPKVPRRPAVVALLLALVILVVAVLLVRHDRARPAAFEPGDLGLSVTTALVPASQAVAELEGLGAPTDLQPPPGAPSDPVFVGRLGFTLPAGYGDDSLVLLVTGPRGTTSPDLVGAGALEPAGRGWGSEFNGLAKRYPWLKGTAGTRTADGSYTNASQALFVPREGPLIFVGPPPADVTTAEEAVVTVLLVRGDQVLWAQRVPRSGIL